MSSHVALSQDQARGVLLVLGPALTLCNRGENGREAFPASTLPRDRKKNQSSRLCRSRLCCRWDLDVPLTWNPHLKLARVGPDTASSLIVKRGQPTTARPSTCTACAHPLVLPFGRPRSSLCFLFFGFALYFSLSFSLCRSLSILLPRSVSLAPVLLVNDW